ncbi:hypothetical protein LNK20_21300, partial [Bacillus safensis]|nr:hypothetical protein [Bacillus safensis]
RKGRFAPRQPNRCSRTAISRSIKSEETKGKGMKIIKHTRVKRRQPIMAQIVIRNDLNHDQGRRACENR